MAVTTTFYGSIIPTLNQHHIIGTISSAVVCQFFLDAGNMQNGDDLELRVVDKMSLGTPAALFYGAYSNYQATQLKCSPPLAVGSQAYFSIRQTAGTARTFFFEVRQI